MSTLMRPSGRLPARVYWVRRLLLLLVVAVAISVLWWFFAPGGEGRQPDAATGMTTGTPTSMPSTEATTEVVPSTPSARTPTGSPSAAPKTTPGTTPSATPPTQPPSAATPLAQPTGPCSPSNVDMEIDVADATAGESNVATFILTTTDSSACTLAITPNSLVTRVTSGRDVVWSSSECPNELPVKELVVRPDPPSAYQFTWDGSRSTTGCRGASPTPNAGGYWIEAALVGGEPHRAFFDLTD